MPNFSDAYKNLGIPPEVVMEKRGVFTPKEIERFLASKIENISMYAGPIRGNEQSTQQKMATAEANEAAAVLKDPPQAKQAFAEFEVTEAKEKAGDIRRLLAERQRMAIVNEQTRLRGYEPKPIEEIRRKVQSTDSNVIEPADLERYATDRVLTAGTEVERSADKAMVRRIPTDDLDPELRSYLKRAGVDLEQAARNTDPGKTRIVRKSGGSFLELSPDTVRELESVRAGEYLRKVPATRPTNIGDMYNDLGISEEVVKAKKGKFTPAELDDFKSAQNEAINSYAKPPGTGIGDSASQAAARRSADEAAKVLADPDLAKATYEELNLRNLKIEANDAEALIQSRQANVQAVETARANPPPKRTIAEIRDLQARGEMYLKDLKRLDAADVLEAGQPAIRSADGKKVRRIPIDQIDDTLKQQLKLTGVDIDAAEANSHAASDPSKPRYGRNAGGKFLELPEETLRDLENSMNGVKPAAAPTNTVAAPSTGSSAGATPPVEPTPPAATESKPQPRRPSPPDFKPGGTHGRDGVMRDRLGGEVERPRAGLQDEFGGRPPAESDLDRFRRTGVSTRGGAIGAEPATAVQGAPATAPVAEPRIPPAPAGTIPPTPPAEPRVSVSTGTVPNAPVNEPSVRVPGNEPTLRASSEPEILPGKPKIPGLKTLGKVAVGAAVVLTVKNAADDTYKILNNNKLSNGEKASKLVEGGSALTMDLAIGGLTFGLTGAAPSTMAKGLRELKVESVTLALDAGDLQARQAEGKISDVDYERAKKDLETRARVIEEKSGQLKWDVAEATLPGMVITAPPKAGAALGEWAGTSVSGGQPLKETISRSLTDGQVATKSERSAGRSERIINDPAFKAMRKFVREQGLQLDPEGPNLQAQVELARANMAERIKSLEGEKSWIPYSNGAIDNRIESIRAAQSQLISYTEVINTNKSNKVAKLTEFDADKDGKMTLKDFDLNNDGIIDGKEREVLRKAGVKESEKIYEKGSMGGDRDIRDIASQLRKLGVQADEQKGKVVVAEAPPTTPVNKGPSQKSV